MATGSDDDEGEAGNGTGGYADEFAQEDSADEEERGSQEQQWEESWARKLPDRGQNDDEEDYGDKHNIGESEEDPREEYRKRMYTDPICINNISRSLRVIPMKDAQVVAGRDGYCYFFTSMSDGPMLSSMAMQQIQVLLQKTHCLTNV